MNIYEAAGYDKESFAKLVNRIDGVVGTGNTHESIVRKGAETFDRDSYVAGLLIGIQIGRSHTSDVVGQ